MGDRFRRLAFALAAATAALMLSPQLGAVTRLPDEMVLDAGAVTVIPVSSAVVADASGADGAIARLEAAQEGGLRLTAGDTGEGRLTFSLLGVVPLRTVKLSVRPERVLVPGGQSVGVAMTTGGVVVVGNSDLGPHAQPGAAGGIEERGCDPVRQRGSDRWREAADRVPRGRRNRRAEGAAQRGGAGI